MLLTFINLASFTIPTQAQEQKLSIVATLFPQYDFAKEIVKEKGEVSFLLSPGVEAHSFEPTPQAISKIKNADLFIYTGYFMEPWVAKIMNTIDSSQTTILDLSANVELLSDDDHGGIDPHYWLDPSNAQIMVADIVEAIEQIDPLNAGFYRSNGANYQAKLATLDQKFTQTFAQTKNHTLVYGGHFAFGYFAKRYGLDYISPYHGFAPDAEPSPRRIVELIKTMTELGLMSVYYEELIDPKIARTIAEQTGAKMLLLHGAHNISKEELNSGVSYLEIMEGNLERLKEGLDYYE